jgi:hypothetical protein
MDAPRKYNRLSKDAVRQAAWTRMANAGAQLLNWFAVVCEL